MSTEADGEKSISDGGEEDKLNGDETVEEADDMEDDEAEDPNASINTDNHGSGEIVDHPVYTGKVGKSINVSGQRSLTQDIWEAWELFDEYVYYDHHKLPPNNVCLSDYHIAQVIQCVSHFSDPPLSCKVPYLSDAVFVDKLTGAGGGGGGSSKGAGKGAGEGGRRDDAKPKWVRFPGRGIRPSKLRMFPKPLR